MNAAGLQSSLAAAGLAADVEGRERLALIRAHDAEGSQAFAARRLEVISLALAHGFSHVALELAPPRERTAALRSDAALPGD